MIVDHGYSPDGRRKDDGIVVGPDSFGPDVDALGFKEARVRVQPLTPVGLQLVQAETGSPRDPPAVEVRVSRTS